MGQFLSQLKRYWVYVLTLSLALPLSAQAAADYQVSHNVGSEWNSGYNADITIKNTGSSAIRDWQLSFDYPQKITSLWNGSIANEQGNSYVVKPAGWNSIIEPGQTVTVGFTAQKSGDIKPPTNVKVTSKTDNDNNNPPDNDNGDLTVNATASGWNGGFTGNIEIVNNSDKPISSWKLSFDSSAKITSSWSSDMSAQSDHFVFENAAWNGQIAPGASISFGYSAEGEFKPLTNCVINGAPCTGENVTGGDNNQYQGSVEFSLPNAPQGVTAAPSITITGGNYPSGKTVAGEWAKPVTISSLADGKYTFSGEMIHSDNDSFQPTFSPADITISKDQPNAQVTVHYVAKEKGKISIHVMNKPEAIANHGVTPEIQITNVTQNKPVKSPALTWGTTVNTDDLIAGDQYKITATTLSLDNGTKLIPTVSPETVTVAGKTTTPVNLSYQVQTPPPVEKGTVKVTVNGVPTDNNVALTFHNTIDNEKINQSVSSKGGNIDLPVGNYSVSAAAINFNNENYYANVQPAIISVSKSTPAELVVTYSKSVASKQRFVVYWTSWQAKQMQGTPGVDGLPDNVTAINLSFANINPTTLAVEGSDNMLVEPSFDPYWMPAQYTAWTDYKYHHPQVKMLIAFGGQTYDNLWKSTLTPNNADAIAKKMAEAVTKDYPAYIKVDGKYQQVGFVQLDGIDLDAEASSRMSAQEADNIVLLIKALRKHLPADKVISLTSFSVAADPASCQFGGDASTGCSYPGSQWSGEMIPVLQQASGDLDWVNDMAYDAAQNYNYQLSLNNYAKYVPKEKMVLGLTIGVQWGIPSFTESMEEILSRAAWQKAQGFGGVFVWALGSSNTEPYVKLKQIGDQLTK